MHVFPFRFVQALALQLLCLVCGNASASANLKGNTCIDALTS